MLLSILMMALASPAFDTYTYIVFILFYPKWWTIVLSYVWVLFTPFEPDFAIRFAWILPLVMIIHTNWHESWWVRRQTTLADKPLT